MQKWMVVSTLALVAGCGGKSFEPPPGLVEMAQKEPAPEPDPMREVTGQTVQRQPPPRAERVYQRPAKGQKAAALNRLRMVNQEASRDVFDGYFTGATINYRWREGEIFDAILA